MALKAKERAKRGDEVRTIERRDELPPPLTVSSQPIDSSCEKDPEVAARRLVVNFPSTESLQIGSFLRRKSFNDFHSHIYHTFIHPTSFSVSSFISNKKSPPSSSFLLLFFFFSFFFLPCILDIIWIQRRDYKFRVRTQGSIEERGLRVRWDTLQV